LSPLRTGLLDLALRTCLRAGGSRRDEGYIRRHQMKKIVLIGRWFKGKKSVVIDLQAYRELKKEREEKQLEKKSSK
jgi:hypothetical protein